MGLSSCFSVAQYSDGVEMSWSADVSEMVAAKSSSSARQYDMNPIKIKFVIHECEDPYIFFKTVVTERQFNAITVTSVSTIVYMNRTFGLSKNNCTLWPSGLLTAFKKCAFAWDFSKEPF